MKTERLSSARFLKGKSPENLLRRRSFFTGKKENTFILHDYSKNPMKRLDYIRCFVKAETAVILLDYLFYENRWMLIPLQLIPLLYLYREIRRKKEARRKKLSKEFMGVLDALSVSVQTGASMENAIHDARVSLSELYGTDSDMLRELDFMEAQLKLNIPVETLFRTLGNRSGIEEIKDFASILMISRKSGGNLTLVLRRTAQLMREKRDVEEEMQAGIAAKKMEQNIMSLMPAVILLYLKFTSPGFLSVLYKSDSGWVLMSICLVLYGGAWWLGDRMLEIEM